MANYYVDKIQQFDGHHTVHKEGCSLLPESENRIDLGNYDNGADAVKNAEKKYSKVFKCFFCSNNWH